jgi:hypothetical protein
VTHRRHEATMPNDYDVSGARSGSVSREPGRYAVRYSQRLVEYQRVLEARVRA